MGMSIMTAIMGRSMTAAEQRHGIVIARDVVSTEMLRALREQIRN